MTADELRLLNLELSPECPVCGLAAFRLEISGWHLHPRLGWLAGRFTLVCAENHRTPVPAADA